MKLSVIIVNYNVKHFLEQCLYSVERAMKDIEAEVFVVDNNSVDGSRSMVQEKFPGVRFISNKENVGFSKANNQAIRQAAGEYILLLNPDTVVEEHCFEKCIAFMDSHPEAGALGVKMIDGKGHFLPESKRSLPTPAVAFYKIFGISKLFPHSRVFGKYHLGYLSPNQIHEVEILSGAFMFIRKSALDKVGLLDENFFMYGEDIDLSYRLIKAGYTNYYFPNATIIHYKGESTKKASFNYVLIFYKAMILFAAKHFSKTNARLFSLLIHVAIYLRALLSLCHRLFLLLLLPVLDASVIYAGFYILANWWEHLKFHQTDVYPIQFYTLVIPAYIGIWIVNLFFSGAYDGPVKPINILKGIISGSLFILILYALLPEHWRFSRAMILMGTTYTIFSIPIVRLCIHFFAANMHIRLDFARKKRIIIAGHEEEAMRVHSLIRQSAINAEIVGCISPDGHGNSPNYLGQLPQINDIIRINKVDEVIFCAKEITSHDIIKYMLSLSAENIDFKIAPPESLSVIGSSSANTNGELYVININSIVRPDNKRNKRLFDMGMALFVMLLSPLLPFVVKKTLPAIVNACKVLLGYNSWVSYYCTKDEHVEGLPLLKRGVLHPLTDKNIHDANDEYVKKINLLYAKEYSVFSDIRIFFKNIKHIGSSV